MSERCFEVAKKSGHYERVVGANNYKLMLKAHTKKKKELKALENLDGLFNITVGEYKDFNCLPYILNSFAALSRFHYESVMLDLYDIFGRHCGDYFYKSDRTVIEYLRTEDTKGLLDLKVLYSLHITHKSSMIIELVEMIIKFGGLNDIIGYLYDFYFLTMLDAIDGRVGQCFYIFKDASLCNTEVVGYYMALIWLLKITPELKVYGGSYVRKLDIIEKFHQNIPEKSVHAKYIMGDIDSEDLYERCSYNSGTRIRIMCPIVEKEHLAIMLEGDYDGYEPDRALRIMLDDWADDVYGTDALLMVSRSIIGTFLFNNKICNELYAKQKDAICLYEKSLEEKEKAEKSARKARVDLKEVEKKVEELENLRISQEKEIHILQEKSSDKLEKEVKDLTDKVKDMDTIISTQNEKILCQKKELSTQKKLVRKLETLVPKEDTEVVVEEVTKQEVTLEDAIEVCKDKKILIVGGYGLGNLENKFEKYGINNVNMVVEARTINGDYDVVIALVKVMRHMMVNLVDKYCDDSVIFIPYNGTNVEGMIKKIAEEYNECSN